MEKAVVAWCADGSTLSNSVVREKPHAPWAISIMGYGSRRTSTPTAGGVSAGEAGAATTLSGGCAATLRPVSSVEGLLQNACLNEEYGDAQPISGQLNSVTRRSISALIRYAYFYYREKLQSTRHPLFGIFSDYDDLAFELAAGESVIDAHGLDGNSALFLASNAIS